MKQRLINLAKNYLEKHDYLVMRDYELEYKQRAYYWQTLVDTQADASAYATERTGYDPHASEPDEALATEYLHYMNLYLKARYGV